MTKKEMLGQMEELKSTCVDICTNLWNNPETGGNEQKSADMIHFRDFPRNARSRRSR